MISLGEFINIAISIDLIHTLNYIFHWENMLYVKSKIKESIEGETKNGK